MMSADAETSFYVGSTKFTRLSAILRLMNLKVTNGWMDKSFTELLVLLNEMLPGGNTLPTQNYDATKILCLMDMEYRRIHACPNDCILYIKEFEDLKKCPKCGSYKIEVESRVFASVFTQGKKLDLFGLSSICLGCKTSAKWQKITAAKSPVCTGACSINSIITCSLKCY